jgi:diguanylate cyclase (GGDEF)-like protein/PAS domain S-box-containing protein
VPSGNLPGTLLPFTLVQDLFDHTPDIIYFKDLEGHLLYVNEAHAIGLGSTAADIIGKTDFELFPKTEAEAMTRDDQHVILSGKPIIDKIEFTTRPGEKKCVVSTTKIPRRDTTGVIIGIMGITRDITRRHKAEQALHLERKIKEDILNAMEVPTFVLNPLHEVIHWNDALARLSGLKATDMVGTREHWRAYYQEEKPCLADCLLEPESLLMKEHYPTARVEAQLADHTIYENWVKNPRTGKRFLRTTATILRDTQGDMIGVIESSQDLTEHKHLQEDLQQNIDLLSDMALKDSLTSLYNRRYFMARLLSEWKRAERAQTSLSLVMLDIDYFKSFNDAYGHRLGDMILSEMGNLLIRFCRDGDIPIRYGGDEFIVLLPDTEIEGVTQFTHRLLEAVSEHSFTGKTDRSRITISAGTVSYPDAGIKNELDFLKAAEEAFRKAKETGGNTVKSYTARQENMPLPIANETGVHDLRTKIQGMENRMQHALMEFLKAFAKSLEGDLYYSPRHTQNMEYCVQAIADEMNLSDSDKQNLILAAAIYDIGKIGVGDQVLNKKGKLDEKEKNLIEEHPRTAFEILKGVDALRGALPSILYHHERFDGKGYLHGLSGNQIPLGARILALADTYLAMLSPRPYRKAKTAKQAALSIEKESGGQFDPEVVTAWKQCIQRKQLPANLQN